MNKPIIDFYTKNGLDNRGRSLNWLWNQKNLFLETSHDYIQWMFPLDEKSSCNSNAPVLSKDDIRYFQNSIVAKNNMAMSLRCMLEFYKLEYSEQNNKICISMPGDAKKLWWLTKCNHNYLRLTRILRSLVLFGLQESAQALYMCLKGIYETSEGIISEETFNYWKEALN